MEIEIKLFNNRTYSCSSSIIGKLFENNSTTLKFYLTKEMANKHFYIEFEKPDGKKMSTSNLAVNEDRIVSYTIPNSLLDKTGELRVEVILRDVDDYVFKSYAIRFNILSSINATDEITEGYPDFVADAQKVLDIIKTDGDGEMYLSNDGTYKSIEGLGADYNELENKPSINNIELSNNKTLEELGIQPSGDYVTNQYLIKALTNYVADSEIADVALTGLYDDLKNKPIIPTVPSEVSAFNNDAGYLTSIPSEYITETELATKGYITSIPSNYVTESELTSKGYLTEHQSLDNYYTKEEVDKAISNKFDSIVDGDEVSY